MHRKRLRHAAQNLGQMFCGYQLMHDWEALTHLVSGTIDMDLLASSCTHNGHEIPALTMLQILGSWLREDLEAHEIPLDSLREAKLTVEFETERYRGRRDKQTSWARPTRDYIGCKLRCTGTIATDEQTYTSTYSDLEEWPANYGGIKDGAAWVRRLTSRCS